MERPTKTFSISESYNKTNLAWVRDLSYWQGGKTKKQRIAFFEQLAEISDEEIETYVEKLHKSPEKHNIAPDKDGWLRMFREKRDEVKKHLSLIFAQRTGLVGAYERSRISFR